MKKTFIFYNDRIDYTEEMSLEEKWLFLQTILNHQSWKDLWNISDIKFVWSRVKKQLDNDNQKRSDEIEKRRISGQLWWLKRASKSKQVLASASKSKQLQADNVNVNVTVNDNDNKKDNIIISTNVDTKSNDFEKKETTKKIDALISKLKSKCDELWVAYEKKKEREFGRHILTAKDYWVFCEKIGKSREDTAELILMASVQSWYWKWPRSWPMTIYQDYADVVNHYKKEKEKKQKPANSGLLSRPPITSF